MTDWETTKIKGDVKARAKEDPRTYTEIMEDGLNTERVTSTDEDPLAAYEDFRDVIQQAVNESFDGRPQQTVDLEATTINKIADEIEGRLR